MDEKDKAILGELIKTPKITNASISTKIAVPEKTVARRRKEIEVKYIDTIQKLKQEMQHQYFNRSAIYTIIFNNHITRKDVQMAFLNGSLFSKVRSKHITFAFISDSVDKVKLSLFLESYLHEDIIEIVNADILPVIRKLFGDGAIHSILKSDNFRPLILHTNYRVTSKGVEPLEDIYLGE